jgi:K(+)-stimulated pyrophosphate-energized sodium pump
MNPVIKFTTLFGLLAVEFAEQMSRESRLVAAAIFFAVAIVFVYRSFYKMRIHDGGELVKSEPGPVAVQ